MPSSSSDSDVGERIRNVQSLLIKSKDSRKEKDEDHACKRKLGDLIFDANFEGGNLGFVEQIDDYEFELMVRPDVANPRHRLWFNFTVSNQRSNQCVIFTFVNLSENLRLWYEGLTPVVRSRIQPNWCRLDRNQVFYYRSENYQGRRVLSIAFRFACHDNEHQFALFYPYTYSTLMEFLSRCDIELKRRQQLENEQRKVSTSRCESSEPRLPARNSLIKNINQRRSHSSLSLSSNCKTRISNSLAINERVILSLEQIATTTLAKQVPLITIKSNLTHEIHLKVIILSRFSGNMDSVASYVCQGLLDFVLSDDPIAKASREAIEFHVAPMLDPDSVCAGNCRSDILGQVMTWKIVEANPTIYENYINLRDRIQSLSSQASRVVLIELRVNQNLIGSRIIGRHYDDSARMEQHLYLPRVLSRFAESFYAENCSFLRNATHLLVDLKSTLNVDQYRLELSPFAAHKRTLKTNEYEELDQIKYLSIGKALVYALVELVRHRIKMPNHVVKILEEFLPNASDIDELTLASDIKILQQK